MKIFIIIATFNEKGNIGRLIRDVLKIPSPIEIVVVDDNSPDGTGRLMDDICRAEERVHVIHRPGKMGLGTAHIAGFKYAIEKKADFILTMDADFSHDPSYIPAVLKAAVNADVVIGSRYVGDGGMVNSPIYRRWLSKYANLFAKTMLGIKAFDCTAGFRCYKVSVFDAIDLSGTFPDGYSFLIEILYRLQNRDFSIHEVPIKFMDREIGDSKISKNEIIKALRTVLRLARERWAARPKPL